jgi:hypothetical protein
MIKIKIIKLSYFRYQGDSNPWNRELTVPRNNQLCHDTTYYILTIYMIYGRYDLNTLYILIYKVNILY